MHLTSGNLPHIATQVASEIAKCNMRQNHKDTKIFFQKALHEDEVESGSTIRNNCNRTSCKKRCIVCTV